MRWIVLVVLMAAPVSAADYSEREACMNELSKVIATADAFSNQREVRSSQFATVPSFGGDHVENIVSAFEDIEAAWRAIADEMFSLCSKYPPD